MITLDHTTCAVTTEEDTPAQTPAETCRGDALASHLDLLLEAFVARTLTSRLTRTVCQHLSAATSPKPTIHRLVE